MSHKNVRNVLYFIVDDCHARVQGLAERAGLVYKYMVWVHFLRSTVKQRGTR